MLVRLALACAVALQAANASGEVQLLEVVGAVPLDEQMRASGIPKERAIDEALWEGVARVADDLLVDSILLEPEPGADGDGDAEGAIESGSEEVVDPIRAALGDDMVPYTRSFRIVDDQGERPALFTDNPDAATEYVVVVEVQVETERVRERLVAAGLLEDEEQMALSGIELEVRELGHYGGYAELVALLISEPVGAASASPREMERGRALLHIEAEWGATELLERLLAAAPPALRITPVEVREPRESGIGWTFSDVEPARLVIAVEWAPEPPEPAQPDHERPEEG